MALRSCRTSTRVLLPGVSTVVLDTNAFRSRVEFYSDGTGVVFAKNSFPASLTSGIPFGGILQGAGFFLEGLLATEQWFCFSLGGATLGFVEYFSFPRRPRRRRLSPSVEVSRHGFFNPQG